MDTKIQELEKRIKTLEDERDALERERQKTIDALEKERVADLVKVINRVNKSDTTIELLDGKIADLFGFVKGNFKRVERVAADIEALTKSVAAIEKHLSLSDKFFDIEGTNISLDTTEEDENPTAPRSNSLKTTQLKI